MKNPRITNGFDRLNDPELLTRARSIVQAMKGNPYFPAPDPSLADVSATIDDYSNALSDSIEGSRLDAAVKKQKRNELISILHLLGDYVMFVTKRDKVKMISSGFTVNKEPEAIQEIDAPKKVKVKDGMNTGELYITIGKVKGARAYNFQYTADVEPPTEQTEWQTQSSTITKCLLRNLKSGKRYWCRVAAIGINQQLVYSDAVSRIVQ